LSYWLLKAIILVMSGSALSPSASLFADAVVIRFADPDGDDGRIAADPFASTADLVALLRVHAADVAARPGRRRELLRRVGADARWRPAFARG
jgi:hypothetical protein